MLLNNYTQQEYKSHHVIIPSNENTGALLLGDLNAATDPDIIKKYNIRTIITAASGLEHLKIPSELTHVVFPLMDTKQQNIATYFQLSFRTIEENLKRGAVLVHCGAGISRSASLIIAYYMKKYNSTFNSAITHVKKIKSNICPNLGFELQLKNYQSSLGLEKEQQTIKQKKSIHSQKNNIVSSPYVFQIPLKTKNQTELKNNSKNINHLFNKMHGEKNHQKAQNVKSEFLIEGKNADNQRKQIEKRTTLYEPQKYSRKYAKQERGSFSAVKRPKNDPSIFQFKH